MPDFTQREQSLLDALGTRLEDADAITTDVILKEVEASQEYKNPSHPDHGAFLHMVPLAMGRQMELAGQAPNASGTDMDSSMLDNQRFTHDIHPQDKPLDFSDEDKKYNFQRENTQNYLTDLLKGRPDNVPDVEHQAMITGAQQQLIELDTEHASTVQTRTDVLGKLDKQEQLWEAEKAEKTEQMKTDFMATRLKGVLKDDVAQITKQSEKEWARLKSDYGF